LIQADFLLTANRTEIDQSCAWNTRLRNEICTVFLDAVGQFNQGPLRYHWAHYLPDDHVSTLFESTKREIIRQLSNMTILESCAQIMEKPVHLTYIPLHYRDSTGVPLTLSERSAPLYLSTRYPAWEIDGLYRLGVSCQSPLAFLSDLEALCQSDIEKPSAWHSSLAGVLLPLMSDEVHRQIVSRMKLIPLRNGRWVSARNTVYSTWSANGASIPCGIEINFTHLEAEKDETRRRLFEQLGVKKYDPSEVCRAIISVYSDPIRPFSLSLEDSIAQITYLYSVKWERRAITQIWVATATGTFLRGSDTYIKRPNGSQCEQRIYDLLHTKFPFIHDSYAAAVPKADQEWWDWMAKRFDVLTVPRLCKRVFGRDFGPSPELEFLMVNGDPRDVLWFLRQNWKTYQLWIETNASPTTDHAAHQSLRKILGSLEIKCRNGVVSTLCNTFLPFLDAEVELHPKICTLDLPERHSLPWSFLEVFGVTVKVDVQYYVHCLSLLQDTALDKYLAVHIYEKIQAFYSGYKFTVAYVISRFTGTS